MLYWTDTKKRKKFINPAYPSYRPVIDRKRYQNPVSIFLYKLDRWKLLSSSRRKIKIYTILEATFKSTEIYLGIFDFLPIFFGVTGCIGSL